MQVKNKKFLMHLREENLSGLFLSVDKNGRIIYTNTEKTRIAFCVGWKKPVENI